MSIKTVSTIILIVFIFLGVTTDVEARRFKPVKIKKLAKEIDKSAVDQQNYFQESFPQDEENSEHERQTGSLWVDSYNSKLYNNLHRASRVGDMVTIMIDESAEGREVAQTKADKKSSQKFGVTGLFGLVSKLTGAVAGITPESMVEHSNEMKHNGQGETKRSGSLSATITARVTRVLKNGDLQIRGQKNIRVNEEERSLILEGFIRPYDISANNLIMSSQIADARITFNGFGILANKQKQGWLTTILEKILPF